MPCQNGIKAASGEPTDPNPSSFRLHSLYVSLLGTQLGREKSALSIIH